MPNYYLYKHIRLDTNEVFYIGIGTQNKSKSLKYKYYRAFSKKNRNNFWHSVVNKCKIYSISIVFETNDYQEIIKKEVEYIAKYGRRDLGLGTLVNLTNGGDGIIGYNYSKEWKKKLQKKSAKEIYQYSINGNFINKFASVGEVFIETNIKIRFRKEEFCYKNNFFWCRKDYGSVLSLSLLSGIFQYSLEGKFLNFFRNYKEIRKYLGQEDVHKVRNVICRNKHYNVAYGFVWFNKYVDNTLIIN